MDDANVRLAAAWVTPTYANQGAQALRHRARLVKALLSSRRLPTQGWDEAAIARFVDDASAMDSNNFPQRIGVGEREGRLFCPLVRQRHYGLAHGVGRSGDVAAVQPKAAGSSLLVQLANRLVLDAIRAAGCECADSTTVLPLATGMGITAVLTAVARRRRGHLAASEPDAPPPRHCVWLRVDQKTCLKAIASADLVPVVVELQKHGDELRGNAADVAAAIERLPGGARAVACVVSTTSCFAPRAADDVYAIGKLCRELDLPHVVNHAYGIQSRALNGALDRAWRRGARIDACVSSTDKNFGVPVGGCVIFESVKVKKSSGRKGGERAAPPSAGTNGNAPQGDAVLAEGTAPPSRSPASSCASESVVQMVNAQYPGRACIAPALDVLLTLLHLGREGWLRLLDEREACYEVLRDSLDKLAKRTCDPWPGRTLSVLESPGNPISIGIGVAPLRLDGELGSHTTARAVTFLGAMLYQRGVTGARVVPRGAEAKVAGISFVGYGASTDDYPTDYLTAAAAIGGSKEECLSFCERLWAVLEEEHKNAKKEAEKRQSASEV